MRSADSKAADDKAWQALSGQDLEKGGRSAARAVAQALKRTERKEAQQQLTQAKRYSRETGMAL